MKLIDNWKDFPKMFSVQAMAAVLAIQAAWETMPADLKAQVPPNLAWLLSITLLALGIVGRLIKQDSISDKDDDSSTPPVDPATPTGNSTMN